MVKRFDQFYAKSPRSRYSEMNHPLIHSLLWLQACHPDIPRASVGLHYCTCQTRNERPRGRPGQEETRITTSPRKKKPPSKTNKTNSIRSTIPQNISQHFPQTSTYLSNSLKSAGKKTRPDVRFCVLRVCMKAIPSYSHKGRGGKENPTIARFGTGNGKDD